jgi:COMPASS component SWD3
MLGSDLGDLIIDNLFDAALCASRLLGQRCRFVNATMSNTPTPDNLNPSRKRSLSPDPNRGASLDYAYADDEDDPHSESSTPHHNGDTHDSTPNKRRKTAPARPKRLNYQLHMTLHGHTRGIASAKFSPDGKTIASCSADSTVKLWNAATGALMHTLEGHLAGINTISFSPDSKVLASGSDDKLIRLWDVETGKCMPTPLVGHHNYVYSLAFSPKGNMLVSGSYDEAVFLWDIRTARLMRSLPAHSDPVSGVDFVRDGTLIASCSSDGLIRIWDTGTGQCLKTLVHEDNAAVTSVKFSPNGKFVLAATLDNSVRLWNYVEGRCVKTYQGHKNEKYSINACFGTYTADVTALQAPPTPESDDEDAKEREPMKWAFAITGGDDGNPVLWDVSSKEVLQRLEGHEGTVLAVDVSCDEQTIITAGLEGVIRVWKRMPLLDDETKGHMESAVEEQEDVHKNGEDMPSALEQEDSMAVEEG